MGPQAINNQVSSGGLCRGWGGGWRGYTDDAAEGAGAKAGAAEELNLFLGLQRCQVAFCGSCHCYRVCVVLGAILSGLLVTEDEVGDYYGDHETTREETRRMEREMLL